MARTNALRLIVVRERKPWLIVTRRGGRMRVRKRESQDHKELFHRTPGCTGEIVMKWSGVKCSRCSGWYCA